MTARSSQPSHGDIVTIGLSRNDVDEVGSCILFDIKFKYDFAAYDMEFGHELAEYDMEFGHDLAEYGMKFGHDLAEYYYVNLWRKLKI